MTRGYAAIGLVNPKTPANLGSVLRAAGCYGAAIVMSMGQRFSAKTGTNTNMTHKKIPYIQVDDLMDAIPFDCVPVVVELEAGATPIQDFTHPERAFYILGPEDGDVPTRISTRCKHHVYIPTVGCMNLAATANVILFDRMMKRQEFL